MACTNEENQFTFRDVNEQQPGRIGDGKSSRPKTERLSSQDRRDIKSLARKQSRVFELLVDRDLKKHSGRACKML